MNQNTTMMKLRKRIAEHPLTLLNLGWGWATLKQER